MLERLVGWADPNTVVGVRDGDLLAAGGRQFVCVVSPGHATGHLSLWDPAARVLFSGDHLLARIFPSPSLERGERATRRHGLVEYLAGLPRFVAFDPTVLLPGHGRAFTAMAVLNTWLHAHSRRRADDIAAILLDRPATPFEIAHRLQWQPEGARLLVGLAHVQGHLDLLQEAGRVIRGHRRRRGALPAARVTARLRVDRDLVAPHRGPTCSWRGRSTATARPARNSAATDGPPGLPGARTDALHRDRRRAFLGLSGDDRVPTLTRPAVDHARSGDERRIEAVSRHACDAPVATHVSGAGTNSV